MDSSFDSRRRGFRPATTAAALALVAGLGLAFVLCAVLITPRAASAATVEITPYAGYALWDKDIPVKDCLHFGGKLGAYFGMLGIEGNFGYSSLKGDPDETEKAKLMNPSGDLVLRFLPEGTVVPYVLAGGGMTRIKPDGPSAEAVSNYSIDGGAGLLFKLSPMFGVRVEGRDLIVHNKDAAEGDKQQVVGYMAAAFTVTS